MEISILRISRFAKKMLELNISPALKRIDAIESKIDTALSFEKPYLTKREAAAYLGRKEHFVESLIKENLIAYYMPVENGNSIYISKAELDRFITRYMVLSKYQIKAKSKMK